MSLHEFVFSEKRSTRTGRHILFWLTWWIYFATTYYYYVQVGLKEITFGDLSIILLIKTFLLILIHIFSCYTFIYVLLPRFLLRAKYFSLTAGIIMLTVFLLAAGYFIHLQLFPYIDKVYYNDFVISVSFKLKDFQLII